MDALHQDVSNRTKQYKGRTLATFSVPSQGDIKDTSESKQKGDADPKQSIASEILKPAVTDSAKPKEQNSEKSKESEGKTQFSFRDPCAKAKGVSPPQNLIVESADDITLFDTLHRQSATAAFSIPGSQKDNKKRTQSPAKLLPREEPQQVDNSAKMPPADPSKAKKQKPQGIVTKLQDFEQRLRNSLSKVPKK